nr:hypothetical protein [Deinococcus cellulosilyticus]
MASWDSSAYVQWAAVGQNWTGRRVQRGLMSQQARARLALSNLREVLEVAGQMPAAA